MADEDIYLLWTQHKAGMITKSYIRDLIPRIIVLLEVGKIQSAVLLGSMGDYIKEAITLKKKLDEVDELKGRVSELENTIKKFLDKL